MTGRRISISERMTAVERAHAVFTGAEKLPSRPKEREFLAEGLAGAYSLLRMFADNEEDLRAYIDLRKRARAAGAGAAAPPPMHESGKPCEFPLARRAAMRCAEGAFQKFLGVETAEAAADELRRRCNIATRKEFDRDAAARERWHALDGEFGAWLRCAGADAEGTGI